MIKLLVLLFSLIPASLFAQSTVPAPVNQEQWIEQVAYPSVALLFRQTESGSLTFDCTATAFEKKPGMLHDTYRFVTASHCVSTQDGKSDVKLDRTIFYVSADDADEKKMLKAKVIGFGDQSTGDDFAVLEVSTRDKFEVVPLGDDPKSLAGDEIFSITSPLGLGKQVLTGRITSPKLSRPVEEGSISWTGAIMFQMSGFAPGSSGSSLICAKQRAICAIGVGTISSGEVVESVALPVSRFKDFYGQLPSSK